MLSPVFMLLPPQPGCVTMSSSVVKMAAPVLTTSAATVPQPTRACCVRSPAVRTSSGVAGVPILASPPWRPRPPPGCCCCCCCWARPCWERPRARPPCSKETFDLVGVIISPWRPPHLPISLSNNQPLNKNSHELGWTGWASLPAGLNELSCWR